MFKPIFRIFFLSITLCISACGGGSGSSTKLLSQEAILFTYDSIEVDIENPTYLNGMIGGSGVGVLQWQSSQPSIVSINQNTGSISLINSGTVEISVTKKSDGVYSSARASYMLTVNKIEQEALAFDKEYVEIIVDGPFIENVLIGGSGDGSLSFSSSNEEVLEIDNTTGALTAKASGTVTISVTKAASNFHLEATDSYQVSSIELISNLEVLLTTDLARISWTELDSSLEIVRTTEQLCDIDDLNYCENGKLYTVFDSSESPLVDDFLSTTQTGFLILQSEEYRSAPIDITPKKTPFEPREEKQITEFQGKLWLTGGTTESPEGEFKWFNDVWSSTDGVNWTLENETAEFSPRAYHQVLVLNDSMYLIGGAEGDGDQGAADFKSDVWRSTNGVNWERIAQTSPFGGYLTNEVIVFRNRMWAFEDGTYSSDEFSVWSSADGIDWIEEGIVPIDTSIGSFEAYTINGKLFIYNLDKYSNESGISEIWSSEDGKNWELKSTSPLSSNSSHHQITTHNDGLYLSFMRRDLDEYNWYNEGYSSDDGISWNLEDNSKIETNQYRHKAVSYNGFIFFYPGKDQSIWRSVDGADWANPIKPNLEWYMTP